MQRAAAVAALLCAGCVPAQTVARNLPGAEVSPAEAHGVAGRVDAHYNHLSSLRADFAEHYEGLGQTRDEHGSLLLSKPGRMRWTYSDGRLFVLDGRNAISYTPGDREAYTVPARQLDDARSPLRFLLGHTRLEKELDQLTARRDAAGAMVLSGIPKLAPAGNAQAPHINRITLTVVPATGTINALEAESSDGSTTRFNFSNLQENAPASPGDFSFKAPAGVALVPGLPPL